MSKITDEERQMVVALSRKLERSLMVRGLHHRADELLRAAKGAGAHSVAAGFLPNHLYGISRNDGQALGSWFQMDIEVWEQLVEVLRVAGELMAAKTDEEASGILDNLKIAGQP